MSGTASFKQQLDLLIDSGATSLTTFSYINIDPENIFKQGERYFWRLYSFLQIKHLPYSGYFYLFINICVLTGYIRSLTEKIRFTEIYFAGYLCGLLIFSGFNGFNGLRYLLPILPFYLMYLINGFLKLTSFCRHPIKISLTGLLVIIFIYSAGFSDKKSSFIDPSTLNAKHEQLFSFVSDHTQATDIFVTKNPNPRTLSFFTQRPASTYPTFKNNPEWFMGYLQAINTHYIIASPLSQKPHVKQEFDLLFEKYPDRFSLVFNNDTFRVYYLTNNK